MKRSAFLLLVAFATGCGDANDGDANTDTTAMPVDTAVISPLDTAKHINTNTGTYPGDTMNASAPGTGSSPSSPDSRKTTPGNVVDSSR